MACLTDSQVMLYLTTFGYSAEEKEKIKIHINGCGQCQELEQKYRQKITAALSRSKKTCELVQNHLPDYIHTGLQFAQDLEISSHLEECDVCRYYYEKTKKTISFEQAAKLDITVPEDLKSAIKKSTAREMAQLKLARMIDQATETVASALEGVIDYFFLTLTPIKVAVRGRISIFAREIDHKGGDLVVNVGSRELTVLLFSLDDLELGDEKSDDSGFVRFKDIDPGQYKIDVEGYEIRTVERVTK